MLIVPDVSRYQRALDTSYSRPAIIFRGAFGPSMQDSRFLANAIAAEKLWKAGRLPGGAVIYQVPIPAYGSPQAHASFLWRLIGPKAPDWLTGILLDVESWPGTSYSIRGDHSSWLNELYGLHAHKMGHWASVKGYFNAGDGAKLWRHRDARCDYTLAKYSSELVHGRGQVAQQYTDGDSRWPVPKGLPRETAPFGACDHNAYPSVSNGDAFRKLWGRPTHGELTAPPSKPAGPGVYDHTHAHATYITSPDGDTGLFVRDDGRVEVRTNHRHVRYL